MRENLEKVKIDNMQLEFMEGKGTTLNVVM